MKVQILVRFSTDIITSMANKKMFLLVFFGILAIPLLKACSGDSTERNKIVFRDSTSAVQDSLEAMNGYMNRLIKREVNNFFFDNKDFIYINNRRIGRMPISDKIKFLSVVQEETGFSEIESLRFVSLAVFLKDNFLNGCYRHNYFEVYFYNYRQTPGNEYDEQRNIVIFDDSLRKAKGSYIESYKLLDRKNELLLIAPLTPK